MARKKEMSMTEENELFIRNAMKSNPKIKKDVEAQMKKVERLRKSTEKENAKKKK